MSWIDTKDPHQRKKLALLSLGIASVIWGINSPIMKLALLVTPVFLLAFLRFFIASFLMLATKPNLSLAKRDIPLVILCSLCGVTLNIVFFFYGLTLSTALNAGILIASIPIFTLIAASLFLKEKLRLNFILAAVLGAIGILIIIFEPLVNGEFSSNLIGNILLLLSALSWVGYEIISKKLFKTYSAATITYYSFLIGGLTFLPFAFTSFSDLPYILADPNFLLGVLYGVIFTSTLGYFLWQWGLSNMDASRVGFFFYLDPIVGTVASILLLGETITAFFLFGTFFIFSGLYLAEKRIPFSFHGHKKLHQENPT